jgi:type VI secretion system protein ImpL
MKAIDREVTLSIPPEAEPGLAGSAIGKAREYAGKARSAVTGTPASSLERVLVDNQFEDIRLFVNGPGGAPVPADAVLQQLNDLYQLLVAAKVALDTGQTPPSDPAAKVVAEALRQPEPIRSMVQSLATGGTKQVAEKTREKQAVEDQRAREKKLVEEQDARQKKLEEEKAAQAKRIADARQNLNQIDADLRAQIVPFCLKATTDRYPIIRSSTYDVPPEDFSRLFAPGGMLDGFFQKQLAPLVDTSERQWRFKDPSLGNSPALAQFQRAQVIRDVFFSGGATTPTFRLEFKPLEMDASIKQFIIDIDGSAVSYAHGPPRIFPVQFPGPRGRRQIRATISPAPPSGANAITFDGPWAPFRMLDSIQVRQTPQAERFEATIVFEGRRAVFEILATSVRNPFYLPELTEFRCPVGL